MTALREEYPHTSVETLCSLFGKRRQWYYKKSTFVVSENQRAKLLTDSIDYYRGLCPRIGGVKLYVLLSNDLGREITRLVLEVLCREELPPSPLQADTHDQLEPRLSQVPEPRERVGC